jgi:nucleoid-associated protein YgaU
VAPRSNKKTKAAKKTTAAQSKVTIDRGTQKSENNFLDKIQTDLEKNQSYLNLILGALIVIVLGVLIYNYFNKPAAEPAGDLGPSTQQTTDAQGDVTKEGLPGKYTVKEGDTLFLIAQKYYDDGNKYTEIIKENNLTSENIEVGQELNIPKLDMPTPSASESAAPEESPSSSPSASPEQPVMEANAPQASEAPAPSFGKGGAENQTIWGEAISGDTYTVAAGDWLSKIAGRAYGDIYQYEAIAKANNITNPDNIEVGTVLKIPRN